MRRIIKLVTVLCCLFPFGLRGQEYRSTTLDSLNYGLDTAKTARSKLTYQYYIGIETNVYRTSYWDSIITEAHRLRVTAIEAESLDRIGFYLTLQGEIKKAVGYLNNAISIAKTENMKAYLFAPAYHISHAFFF